MRSNHLIADVAYDQTEILQSWEMVAAKHVWKKTTSRLESARLGEAVSQKARRNIKASGRTSSRVYIHPNYQRVHISPGQKIKQKKLN